MPLLKQLQAFPMFAELSSDQLTAVARVAREVNFKAAERLFDEGQHAERCWMIVRGCVAIDANVPGRRPVIVQTLGPGEIVGWSWLIPPYRWHFGAVTVAPTTTIAVDTEKILALAENDPSFGYPLARHLLGMLLNRLQSTRARLLDMYGMPNAR